LLPQETTPGPLEDLTFAEREVIRRVHPFQALLVLPKGQTGARGQVIHLPASPIEKLRQLLPADPQDVLRVAEEKPNGKVGQFHQLRVHKVLSALRYLKEKNDLYANISIREEGEIRELFEKWEKNTSEEAGPDTEVCVEPTHSALLNMEGEPEKRTLSANVNRPVDRRGDFVEALSFPDLFATGRGDMSDKRRPISLTEREYIQHRLLAHPKFQADDSWAFRALNNLNQQDMARKVQFVQRSLSTSHQQGAPTTSDVLQAMEIGDNSDFEKEDVLGKFYFQVGSAIRGTAMYWKKARNHLFSMFATLGAPDLFLTLSANDLNWLDLFQAIDPARFRTQGDVDKLSITEKTALLNAFPAVAAEHFVNRVRALIGFLTSSAKPLGYAVKNFFGRFEIQGRGSPHLHAVLWLDGAPKTNAGQAYLDWVDSAIWARPPDEAADPELYRKVEKLQVHRHTNTCNSGKKSKSTTEEQEAREEPVAATGPAATGEPATSATTSSSLPSTPAGQSKQTKAFFARTNERNSCRFGFPHPLAASTHFRTDAKSRFRVRGDRGIILQRPIVADTFINNYNPAILRIWGANMDLQPVVDPYATGAYMMTYITKNEKNERGYIKETLRGMKPGVSLPEVLRKMGNAILSFREVSKQETMLLLLGIPLYLSSLSTTFVPCYPPALRQKFSLPYTILTQQDPDSTDVWQQGIIEAYARRPPGEPWNSLSLLEFTMWFEVTNTAADRKKQGAESESTTQTGELPAEYEELHLALEGELADADETDPGPTTSAPRPSAFEPNPLWGTDLLQPPFSRKPGEKERRLPRFPLTGGEGKGKIVRMRRTPRCVTSPLSHTRNLTTKYALLAMNVPFRQELPDLLHVTYPGEVTEELVDTIIASRRQEIDSRRSRMAENFAERVQELLSNISEDDQPQERAQLPATYHEFLDQEMQQAMPPEFGPPPSSLAAFITDSANDLPALKQQLSHE